MFYLTMGTPVRAPKANAVCERTIGTLKRECLDHVLIWNVNHLQNIISEFADYYSDSRPHQGIGQTVPNYQNATRQRSANGVIVSRPILNGLHHSYSYT